ncbi:MAG TPA: sulfite exporter TauE/SafE family protein [Actinomycetota bacterium]
MSAADVVIALIVGLIAGASAGLFGVGGGFLMVPAMVLLLDQSQHVAQGTSLLVIVPTTLVGTALNVRRRNVDLPLLVPLAVAGIVGAVLGALASVRLDPDTLRRIFGIVMILVSLRLFVRRRLPPLD